MKNKIALLLVFALALPGVLWGAVQLWGNDYVMYRIEPAADFQTDVPRGGPDYRQARYWAALPEKASAAKLVPGGGSGVDSAPADVFYIHPTSYISGESWNAPLFVDSRAWEMVDIILGAQASAFNGCCEIYAPHYRQATLWSFLDRSENGERALELAYSDVRRAFGEFLDRNGDRPFIVASHSQGTYHALRLLSEAVDGTPLQQRLVAAYLIGYWVPMDTFGRTLKHIDPCDSATDTGCIVHWSTYGERGQRRGGIPHWYPAGHEFSDGKPLLCTNPLNWRRDGSRVEAEAHPGALYVSRGGSRLNTLFNHPAGVKLDDLPPLLPGFTWAECRDGLLRVAAQEDTVFREVATDGAQDYHMIDYSLFYQSVRENAVERLGSFGQLSVSSAEQRGEETTGREG
jgi:hypothetical protein